MISTAILSGRNRALHEWWLLIALFLLCVLASIFSWLPPEVFPDLKALAKATDDLFVGRETVFGTLAQNVLTSVGRLMMGYALSVVIGLALGLLMAASSTVASLTLPVLRFLYPIPGLAWTPLVIMWCGLGEKSVVTLIFLSAVWPVLYGAYDGVRHIPARYFNVSRQLGASWPVRVRKVMLPAALPILISSLRISHGVAWRAIIGAEMIAALSGLGYMLQMAGELRRPDVIVLGMIVIAIISVVLDRILFVPLENRLARKGLRQT
jgi:NitT/TauT family transport system permease protein/taurine transport system permease protein/sulfonate transport system permease protein